MTTHNVESSSHNQSTPHFSRLTVMNQENGLPKRSPKHSDARVHAKDGSGQLPPPVVARSPSGDFWSWWLWCSSERRSRV